VRNLVLANLDKPGWSEKRIEQYQKRHYFLIDGAARTHSSGPELLPWAVGIATAEGEPEELSTCRPEGDAWVGVTLVPRRSPQGPINFVAVLGEELMRAPRHEIVLCHLAPYLHDAMRAAQPATLPPSHPGSPLSSREIEVLNWAMAGKTNWEISMILGISERTVKFHVKNAMGKLGASSRAHAVAIALRQRVIAH
jgi:DNA-binding CsgD family transcriptional regulator